MIYHVVTNSIKKNKNKHNGATEDEPKSDNMFSLSSGNKEPIPEVIVILRGGKKHRATMVAGLTCLWDIESTGSKIKIKYTKYYERRMRSNKEEYSTAAGLYCTTHNIKMTFFTT